MLKIHTFLLCYGVVWLWPIVIHIQNNICALSAKSIKSIRRVARQLDAQHDENIFIYIHRWVFGRQVHLIIWLNYINVLWLTFAMQPKFRRNKERGLRVRERARAPNLNISEKTQPQAYISNTLNLLRFVFLLLLFASFSFPFIGMATSRLFFSSY